jgi:GAF domain-containing protein
MFEGQLLGLSIGIILIGLVVIGLVWFLTRTIIPRVRPAVQDTKPITPVNIESSADAILLIQRGGRVEYLNALAREWFDLIPDETPNLERLARRSRPGERFLELCAAEGRARFSINGRLTEGYSYQIPGAAIPSMLVALRRVDTSLLRGAESADLSSGVLKVITDFSREIASNLNFDSTLRSIFENVERLVASDAMEIKVWDQVSGTLIAYRLTGQMGMARPLERMRDSQFGEYAQHLIASRAPLLINDTHMFTEVRFEAHSTRPAPMRSYIGMPLIAGGDLVGVMELGVVSTNAFSNEDLETLQLLTGQAAIAVRNAILFEKERRRSTELTGLANLAQSTTTMYNWQDLYARLVESISPLFDMGVLGFLAYDEQRRLLQGQAPFLGLPAQFVQIYKTIIAPNTPAERYILNQEIITTDRAAEDTAWGNLGLRDLAQAASIRDAVLVPLVSSGRFLGYLQLSNNKQGAGSIAQDDLRLLKIVANQSAAIIDNALLLQQSRLRSQRAEALRRIASLISSTAPLDETLQYSIKEIAQLMQADYAALFLMDDEEGVMRAHVPSVYGVPQDLHASLQRLNIKPNMFHLTVAGSQRTFTSGHLQEDRRILPLYRKLVRRTESQSTIIVPLIVRDHGIGELMIASREIDFFNNYDVQTLATVAGQLASAVDSAAYTTDNAENLQRRSEQMRVISRVVRELNSTNDVRTILQIVYDESLRISKADCSAVFFFDQGDASWEKPIISHFFGHKPENDLSLLERESISSGEFRLVDDYSQSSFTPPHRDVLSSGVFPLVYQGTLYGMIHVHAASPARFTNDECELLQVLATQSALALNNALRHRDQQFRSELLKRRAETLFKLFEASKSLGITQTLDDVLNQICFSIQSATPFQIVLASIYDPSSGLLRRVAGVGMTPATLETLKAHQQPWKSITQILKPEFKIGEAYMIPYDQTPILPSDMHILTPMTDAGGSSPNAWNPDDLLILPLYDDDGEPLGLLSLDGPNNALRPDRTTYETLNILAAQAALVVNNARRLIGLKQQTDQLSLDLERQRSLVGFSQSNLPSLLRKDLEQTLELGGISQRNRRIRAGIRIIEAISRQLDAPSALVALGRELLTNLDMTVAIISEISNEGPIITNLLGNPPRGANPEALFGQRNPLRYSIQTGETLVVTNLDEDDVWHDTPLLSNLRAKSFICLPIIVDQSPIAAVLAISPEPMSFLAAEDRQVFFQISRQVSLILQNISLLSETRRRLQEVNLLLDFSRRLSGLDPLGIVDTLLDSSLRAVPSAHAGVVLIWNPREELLVPRTAANYIDNDSVLAINYRSFDGLPGRVFTEQRARRVDEVNFAVDYNLPAESLLKYRKATGGRLPISSLLIPIQTVDRALGLLILDNFNQTSAFRAEDEALLLSLTQQVSLSLENVRLVQATEERAGQLQALNNVAATISSSLQIDDLVSSLLDQLGAVLPYDTSILWLSANDQMIVAEARGFDDNEERKGLAVAVADSVLLSEMNRTGKSISVGDVRSDKRFPAFVEQRYLSWLGIPLISKGRVIGVIALEKQEANYYFAEQIQLAETFSSQAAVALDNASLYQDSLRRAAELDERSQRLALINRFSSELSGSLNSDQVLRLTAEQLMSAINAQRAMITLAEDQDSYLISFLPDEAGQPAIYRTLRKSTAFAHIYDSGIVFTSGDIENDAEIEPLREYLEGMKSVLGVPVISGESRYAIFAATSSDHRFGSSEIEIARTLGNQANIALENAHLYQSTLSTAQRLAIINQVSYEIGSSLDPEHIYKAIHEAVAKLMPVDAFVIALLDEAANQIDGVYILDMGQRISGAKLPVGQGLSGRVIASGEPILTLHSAEVDAQGGVTIGEKGTPHSIVGVPMLSGGKTIGMLSAQSYQFNAYSLDDQQLLGTLANQATVAIQNSRLFEQTQHLASTLEQRVVDRTAELEREQRNTETLLRILTEVSASLDLDRALSRTLSLLNEAIGAEQGTIMLLHAEDNLLHYRAGYGYATTEFEASSRNGFKLKVGEGLAGWVVKHRQPVLVEDLYQDARWVVGKGSQQHRSALVAPLIVGEDIIGAIMVFHRKVGYFTDDALGMVKAIGSQVAISINNAQLYELIRDQAERLGSMLRSQQMEASRQTAILEAVADGVLVTDPANRITFLNASAEEILDIPADQALNKTLDIFAGLFGKSTQAWTQTIRSWSDRPAEHQSGDTYAEQLTLDTGRVILVHLAPVIWHSEFLGTVSIFRDITHEVEVDRLKSEFVATVSHELRTPMTSIRGYVDILMMGAAGAMNENQIHFLDIVKSNIDRLNILVNDLLDISRIESGKVILSMQAVDLREMAEEVVSSVLRRSQEEQKPIGVNLDAPQQLPRVSGDPERVRQIIDNLVDNAYHYTPPNGQITISVHAENGGVQVDVSDTGIGIDPVSQDRIFERFYRGDDPLVLATPGTGLGLPIVRQLVEMHHGKIWMQSTGIPGGGSTFSFTLPLYGTEA